MSVKIFVYSTLTASQKYTTWGDAPDGGVRTPVHEVFIQGGANLANKHLITPLGAMTQVTEEDLAHLEKNDEFQRHLKNGHITVRKTKVEVETAVKEMKKKDASAPVTPEDFPKSDGKPVPQGA